MSQTCFSYILVFGHKIDPTSSPKMLKLCRDLENRISIHTNISHHIFGPQKGKTHFLEIALTLFLTTFGITFMMITAWEELLLVSTCAYWIEMSPMDFPSYCHSLSHIEMTLLLRYMRNIWMLPKLTLILLCVLFA